MKSPFTRSAASCAVLALAAALPLGAQAHRQWLQPSSTVLSGSEPWVSVDAATSTDPFVVDHNAARLDGLVVTAPDGTAGKAENLFTGRLRSSFDVKLSQPGTYKLALVSTNVMASWKDKASGETKRWRGTEATLAKEVPADAAELTVTRSVSRNEVFVTAGKPSDKALQPTGSGLELQPITHPNDLFSGEEAKFRFLLDGKPAANLEVTVIPAGRRYRDKPEETKLTTNAAGEFGVKWAAPGLYYLAARAGGGRPQGGPGGPGPQGEAGGAPRPAPAAPAGEPQRRAGYAATLEVLPQ